MEGYLYCGRCKSRTLSFNLLSEEETEGGAFLLFHDIPICSPRIVVENATTRR